MLISIVTVSYNSENTIGKTIESVLNQSYPDVEYLIIDGASKDNTVQIAKSYEEKFREKGYAFRIISEPDKGIYDAMNKGIRNATGEIVGIINSDDWYEPNALQTVAQTYRQEPFDMFYADLNLVKDNGTIIVKRSKMARFVSTRDWNHPTTFITKKCYEDVGLYACENIYDDFELVMRIRHAGKKIVIRNVVLANFRTGGVSNQKSLKKCISRCKIRYRNYRKNGYSRLYMIECIAMEFAKLIIS